MLHTLITGRSFTILIIMCIYITATIYITQLNYISCIDESTRFSSLESILSEIRFVTNLYAKKQNTVCCASEIDSHHFSKHYTTKRQGHAKYEDVDEVT